MPSEVCAGKPLTVTNPLVSLNTIRYYYNYDGKGLPSSIGGSSIPTTIYAVPGSYTILQLAADPNNIGTFACRVIEVQPIKPVAFSLVACGDKSVTLTYSLDAETFRYNTLTINWGDGSNNVIPLKGNLGPGKANHTYATAGNKSVQVVGAYATACAGTPATQPISVQSAAAINPVVRALTSGATTATIDYQGPTGYDVELYQRDPGATSYVPTGRTGTSGVFTVPALPSQVTCFQLVAKETCSATERRSTEVCSLVLNAKAGDTKNVLDWTPYAGTGGTFTRYFVYKNGPPTFSANNRLTSDYTDVVNITCGKQYCYVLEATINNPNTSSQTTVRSLSTCVTGFDNSSVAAPASVYVSVQGGGVNVQARLPTVGLPTPFTAIVSRSDGGGNPFTTLGVTPDGSYLDATANINSQSYCYQVTIRNSCGVLSKPTAPACSILLTRAPNGDLRWTSASPYAPGPLAAYQVISTTQASGVSDKTNPLGSTVTTLALNKDSQATKYQVSAANSQGIESYSNEIEVELGLQVFLPNAFTPNGDDANKSFKAYGLTAFWQTFELTIYSRWGDVVYGTTDKESAGWDGTINGGEAMPGYYGYRIRVTDPKGNAHDRTGQVLLIR